MDHRAHVAQAPQLPTTGLRNEQQPLRALSLSLKSFEKLHSVFLDGFQILFEKLAEGGTSQEWVWVNDWVVR